MMNRNHILNKEEYDDLINELHNNKGSSAEIKVGSGIEINLVKV